MREALEGPEVAAIGNVGSGGILIPLEGGCRGMIPPVGTGGTDSAPDGGGWNIPVRADGGNCVSTIFRGNDRPDGGSGCDMAPCACIAEIDGGCNCDIPCGGSGGIETKLGMSSWGFIVALLSGGCPEAVGIGGIPIPIDDVCGCEMSSLGIGGKGIPGSAQVGGGGGIGVEVLAVC